MSDLVLPPLPGDAPPGVRAIAASLLTMPLSPGVYRMLDGRGEALYVGKARSLRKRVTAYTQPARLSERLRRMVSETVSLEIVTTHTEAEALLLEANLIKRLKPRFNIVLRDDKTYPWLMLTEDHAYPQIAKHRGAQGRRGSTWGPFASAWAVNQTVTAMQRVFLLRSCADTVFSNRSRPCLLHQIKRCSAPCVGRIDAESYGRLVAQAKAFLSGRSGSVQRELAVEMEQAAEGLEFERAAALRDRIRGLTHVQGGGVVNPASLDDADVIAVHQIAGQSCVQVFFVRGGRNNGNRAFFPSNTRGEEDGEVLAAFVAQFYDDKTPPRLILLSHALPEAALVADALSIKASAIKAGRRVELAVPVRGEKRAVVEHAATNAREALERRLAEGAGQAKLLAGVAALFELASSPERIEVYDNSHIMGTSPYGVMIVSGPEGFRKTAYRKYAIRGPIAPGDDFAMMREVLDRRFGKAIRARAALAEAAEVEITAGDGQPAAADVGRAAAVGFGRSAAVGVDQAAAMDVGRAAVVDDGRAAAMGLGRAAGMGDGRTFGTADGDTVAAAADWPDLVLIDGGVGQYSAARAVLDDLGITDVMLVAMGKGPDRDAGREWFHTAGKAPFQLPPRDPVLYYLQRIRDEAHRFAITTHRAGRSKTLVRSELDEIEGIGPGRKRALLNHFGSARGVRAAGLVDLEQAPGISREIARRVYGHFHPEWRPDQGR